MICKKCGTQNDDNIKFCQNCGEPVEAEQPVQQQQPPQPQQPPQQQYQHTQQQYQYQQNPRYMQPMMKPKKKGKGCLIALIIFVVIIGVIIGSLFIFLPGLFKPKDLGVKTTKDAYESALSKLKYNKDDAPSTGEADDYTYEYGSTNYVDTALTSEELTSFFNYNRPDYYAIKDLQIRINDDNTIEVAGALNKTYILESILEGEYTEEEIKEELPMLNLIPGSINFYVNIEGEISDNEATKFDINDVEIMGIGIPDSIYDTSEAQYTLIDIINESIAKVVQKTGTSYDLIKVEDGELIFQGDMPSFLERNEK